MGLADVIVAGDGDGKWSGELFVELWYIMFGTMFTFIVLCNSISLVSV